MSISEENIERLANYLLENWPHEIGAGDPIHGESAIEVAIRLLERLRKLKEVEPKTT